MSGETEIWIRRPGLVGILNHIEHEIDNGLRQKES